MTEREPLVKVSHVHKYYTRGGETIEVPEFRREPAEDERLSEALEQSIARLRKAA